MCFSKLTELYTNVGKFLLQVKYTLIKKKKQKTNLLTKNGLRTGQRSQTMDPRLYSGKFKRTKDFAAWGPWELH
jgi:hypothetical protein